MAIELPAAQVETIPAALLEIISQTDNNNCDGDNSNENLGGHETAISITESTSKIHEPKAYNKAINNLIYGKQWREAIKKELQNLESHYT